MSTILFLDNFDGSNITGGPLIGGAYELVGGSSYSDLTYMPAAAGFLDTEEVSSDTMATPAHPHPYTAARSAMLAAVGYSYVFESRFALAGTGGTDVFARIQVQLNSGGTIGFLATIDAAAACALTVKGCGSTVYPTIVAGEVYTLRYEFRSDGQRVTLNGVEVASSTDPTALPTFDHVYVDATTLQADAAMGFLDYVFVISDGVYALPQFWTGFVSAAETDA
jgi:hypothetical protein